MTRQTMTTRLSVSMVVALIAMMTPATQADPLPGRDILKFAQRPMIATTLTGPDGTTEVFHGHDELSTAWSFFDQPEPGGPADFAGYRGEFMADDFADRFETPVVHVRWWGSYLNRPTIGGISPGVDQFLISFESDIPADPNNPNSFSRPGEPLLNQVVKLGPLTPGSGTFTEKVIPGSTSVDGPIYEYNAELHLGKEFFQKPDTVYWLKIVALVDVEPGTIPQEDPNVIRWGWHNRDYTVMDPLASTPPAVVPGEHIQGFLPAAGGDIPIWHFQDDSVNGFVEVTPNDLGGLQMPDVLQDVFGPQNYVPPFDGPSLIAQYSKDLAFELYTVPEPATAMLLGIGGLLMLWRRRS